MRSFRLICAALALWSLQGCSPEVHSPEVHGPNIIHITADDLGYGELGSFGQALIATPHLDALAAQGMRFTHHYAGNALCNPSRYAFQTGLHAGTTGVVTNGANALPAGTPTIAKMMRGAGYSTGIIGKWALGSASSSGAPLKQGFDYFFGYLDQVAAHDFFPETLMENSKRVRLGGNRASGELNISAVREVYDQPGSFISVR